MISGDVRNTHASFQLRQIVHVHTNGIDKAIKLKLLCFNSCILTSYMTYDKIFCFIDSWGRHVQNIVNQQCIAGGSKCL